MAYLNSNNFCRWSSDQEECNYTVPMYASDLISVYGNFTLNNITNPKANLKVALWSTDLGFYLYDIATISTYTISGDLYTFFFQWSVPQLPPENFRFVLYNAPSTILYYSNTFRKVSNTDYTALLSYQNDVNTLGYYYEVWSLPNTFRVDLRTGRPDFKEEVQGYETYTGDLIKTKSDINKLIEFNTRFMDDGAHEAFFSMLAHSEILIDSDEYKRGSGDDYTITWSEDDDNKIGNGVVNLQRVDYSAAVKRC